MANRADPESFADLLGSPLEPEGPDPRVRRLWVWVASLTVLSTVVALANWPRSPDATLATVTTASTAVGSEPRDHPSVPGVAGVPTTRSFAASTTAGDWLVVFGGMKGEGQAILGPVSPLAETWIFDGDSDRWYLVHQSPESPSAVFGAAMAYDSASDAVVVFGGAEAVDEQPTCGLFRGCAGPTLGTTWVLDLAGGSWHEVIGSGPAGRVGASMAYDTESGRIIMFGGAVRDGGSGVTDAMSDTWAFDLSTGAWRSMAPEASPPPRAFGMMVYDPGSDLVLLWGGEQERPQLEGGDSSVWAYDFDTDTWLELAPGDGTGPEPRWAASWVTLDGQAILMGGEYWHEQENGVFRLAPTQETWAFDAVDLKWSQITALPFATSGHSAAALGERVILFARGTTRAYDRASGKWSEVEER